MMIQDLNGRIWLVRRSRWSRLRRRLPRLLRAIDRLRPVPEALAPVSTRTDLCYSISYG